MPSIEQLHKSLTAEFEKQQKNVEAIGSQLEQIKIALLDAEQIAPLSDAALSTVHKDVFEIGAFYEILRGDMEGFEVAIANVHSFYKTRKEESINKYLMYGLHLMYLLSFNKLSDFHLLLEQIPLTVQQNNQYISLPVNLEQSLMEGAYNKAVLNEKAIPSPYYNIFVRVLMDTVRGDIANCMEKSYKELNVQAAKQMLLCQTDNDFSNFVKTRHWQISGNNLCFDPSMQTDQPRSTLDTKRIALQIIYYAKQLEMIV